MTISTIAMTRLWTDDDGMLQLELCASNTRVTCFQDFYVYPESMEKFAYNLQQFPLNRDDSVTFEYGAAPDFYAHLKLRAFIVNSTGDAALEIVFDNRRELPFRASGHFFLSCEVAGINRLGKELHSWLRDVSEPFQIELYSPK